MARLAGRHYINTVTGEYRQQDAAASWNRRKYGDLLSIDMRVYGCCCTRAVCSWAAFADPEEEKAVQEAMKALLVCRYTEETLVLIDQAEREYACGEREKREQNRRGRQHTGKVLTAKHNDYTLCPACVKRVQAKRRGNGQVKRQTCILLYRLSFRPKYKGKPYYNQDAKFDFYSRIHSDFDDRGNRMGR